MAPGVEVNIEPKLCERCIAIFADGSLDRFSGLVDSVENHYSAAWEAKQEHHAECTSFKRALEEDCRICTQLASSPHVECLERSIWYFNIYQAIVFLSFGIWDGHKHFQDPGVRFIVTPTAGHDAIFPLATRSLQHLNTGHQDVAELAKGWVSQCCESHGTCGLQRDARWYPTRLLRISGDIVYLIVTAEHDLQQEQYATMSHCWGKKPFFTLTSDNLSTFRRGVELARLPKSFQDVLITTRRLGINFLWIDSYCIIQSGERSEVDWQKEAATMKRVYANGIVNIAVAHSGSPYEGCFADRNESLEMPLCVQWLPKKDVNTERASYHIIQDHGSVKYLQLFNKNGLFNRGWVYQERILCARMLYFTHQQLWWECSGNGQMLANEEHPAGMPSPRLKQDIFPWALETSSSKLRQGRQPPLALWSDIVTQYSELALTKPNQDKLLALGGIAERMAQILDDDQYVAGMFARELVAQLTWQAFPEPAQRCSDNITATWRAPSWSWMSLDGRVSYRKFPYHAFAAIDKIDITLKDELNPFGALLSASLSLKGRPIHAVYVPRTGTVSRFSPDLPSIRLLDGGDSDSAEYTFNDDDLREQPVPGSELRLIVTEICGLVRLAADGSTQLLSKDDILSLPTSLLKWPSGTELTLEFYGLVLQKISPNRFSRLGAMILRNEKTLRLLDRWRETAEETIHIM